jgi:hypothetical protein
VKNSWFKGCDDEKKGEVRKDFLSSTVVRKQLNIICLDKIKVSCKSSRNKEDYDCSNWAYKQADSRGYERALAEIMELVK